MNGYLVSNFFEYLIRFWVDYMRRCKEDFEPFFASDEGIDFERHLELLEEDGTYAGIKKD